MLEAAEVVLFEPVVIEDKNKEFEKTFELAVRQSQILASNVNIQEYRSKIVTWMNDLFNLPNLDSIQTGKLLQAFYNSWEYYSKPSKIEVGTEILVAAEKKGLHSWELKRITRVLNNSEYVPE